MQLTLVLKDTDKEKSFIASVMVSLDQVLTAKNPEFLKTLVLKLKRDIEKEMYSAEINKR